jgi:AcrR family transcriptional regulator
VARLPQALQNVPVGRSRVSREELGERQFERIVTAATEVFAKRGFQASTVENIIDAAGIGVGSFYAHFDGKEDCLDAITQRIAAEARESVVAGVGTEEGWAPRLCAGLHELLIFAGDNPLAARVVLLEAQTGGPKAVALHAALVDEVAGYLRSGREASDLGRGWPPAFEEATAGGLVWLAQERLLRGEMGDIDGLFAELAEVALEPYLGVDAARREIKAALSRAGA